MILGDTTILNEMAAGNIIIEPFDRKYLNPASVDLTLHPRCKVYKPTVQLSKPHGASIMAIPPIFHPARLDCRNPSEVEEFDIPEEGYELQPGTVYLYRVNERIGVGSTIAAQVGGKSSLGRLGLFVHVTAGFIDPGFEGNLVLELVATQPLRIYPNQKIAQILYFRVEGKVDEHYGQKQGSKYQGQTGVQESLMHKNFEENEKAGQQDQSGTTAGK